MAVPFRQTPRSGVNRPHLNGPVGEVSADTSYEVASCVITQAPGALGTDNIMETTPMANTIFILYLLISHEQHVLQPGEILKMWGIPSTHFRRHAKQAPNLISPPRLSPSHFSPRSRISLFYLSQFTYLSLTSHSGCLSLFFLPCCYVHAPSFAVFSPSLFSSPMLSVVADHKWIFWVPDCHGFV